MDTTWDIYSLITGDWALSVCRLLFAATTTAVAAAAAATLAMFYDDFVWCVDSIEPLIHPSHISRLCFTAS